MTTCSAPNCSRPPKAKGMCNTHYERVRRTGDVTQGRRRHTNPTCSIDGCDKPTIGRGWCGTHYARWRTHGDPTITLRTYTGRRVTSAGYVEVWCPGHPQAMAHGYALEHRKIMHDLGHDLLGVEVHHSDGDRSNNDPNNLKLMAGGDHQRHHAESGTSNQYGHHGPITGRACEVDGCELPVKSRSWCSAHYTRFIRYGDPLTVRRPASAKR